MLKHKIWQCDSFWIKSLFSLCKNNQQVLFTSMVIKFLLHFQTCVSINLKASCCNYELHTSSSLGVKLHSSWEILGGRPRLFLPDSPIDRPNTSVGGDDDLVCILCRIWSAINFFFILSIWTLSWPADEDSPLPWWSLLVLEGDADRLDAEEDPAFGDVFFDLRPSLSKLMSKRLDTDFFSEVVSLLSSPLLALPSKCLKKIHSNVTFHTMRYHTALFSTFY